MSDSFYQAVVDMASPYVKRIYASNEIPKMPTYPYLVLDVYLSRGDTVRLDASHGVRWGTITIQAFARTGPSALDVMEKFLVAVLDQRPEVDGWDVGPCVMEIDPVDNGYDNDDMGIIGFTAVLVFAATKDTGNQPRVISGSVA